MDVGGQRGPADQSPGAIAHGRWPASGSKCCQASIRLPHPSPNLAFADRRRLAAVRRLAAEREEDAVAVAQRREAERRVFQMNERRPGVEFDVVGVYGDVRRRHRVVAIDEPIHREQAIPLGVREQHVRRVGPRLGARGSVDELVVVAGKRGAPHDFVAAPARSRPAAPET